MVVLEIDLHISHPVHELFISASILPILLYLNGYQFGVSQSLVCARYLTHFILVDHILLFSQV